MQEGIITIFIAGDSTASYYDEKRYPRMGWGQVIGSFFKEGVIIKNEAASGRSSKSFISEGRLDKIAREIKPGDYLFIQFGHNDEKPDEERHTDPYTTYKSTLKQYINTAKCSSAIPVLMTPVSRRKFDENGNIEDTHGNYADAVKQLAYEMDIPVVDICEKSKKLFEKIGEEETKRIFLWLKAGEYENYPEGAEDNTHFSKLGAIEIARLVVQGIVENRISLSEYINEP